MKNIFIGFVVLFLVILKISCQAETTIKSTLSAKNPGRPPCHKQKNGQLLCFCGKDKVEFNPFAGQRCRDEKVVQLGNETNKQLKSNVLRIPTKPLHRSTRDDNKVAKCAVLTYIVPLKENEPAYVPLHNISVEAWIDSFAADVTITQIYVNQEQNPIEAIYVFPIEENAAVYSFTAEIDNRTITAVLKEKKKAEEEFQSAIQQGQTAVLMRQSEETLDTFTVNVGALPPGKQCRITIKYVTELDMIDRSSIRFVVPTTIAPRYNPSLGHLQSPDQTSAEYVQNTSYSISFNAHILRSRQNKINHVANLSHPVNVSLSGRFIDVSLTNIALDRDIILDVDLPENIPAASASIEKSENTSEHAIMLAFTPSLADVMKVLNDKNETNTEFIFIVDCSGSMTEANGIGLAREAMLLFIRSLPLGSHFNIIRFGSHYDILFKNEALTVIYDEKTAKEAETVTLSMNADFGGTELLQPLQYLKDHPPIQGRSRQIFLLTDGEVSNTNQVIDLCRSMASTTRIFSFGLGHSPSRSLVKGLARATNGYFVFVPPNAKVDTYVGSQLDRALQPSIVNARLEWHGLSTNGSQAPKTIPPLYIGDRVLVYQLLEDENLKSTCVSVDLIAGGHKISSIKLPCNSIQKKDTIRRLAAKALIQELQHTDKTVKKEDDDDDDDDDYDYNNNNNDKGDSKVKERITTLSLSHQILSPYTAFVGVETTDPKINNSNSKVRHIPIQISKGDEHMFSRPQPYMSYSLPSGPRLALYGPPMPVAYSAASSSYGFPGNPRGSGISSSHFQAMQHRPMFGMNAPPSAGSSTTRTTTASFLLADPVRWLINQQSFNGVWKLNEKDIEKLTKGKSLKVFHSNIISNKDALTTALAIAILESKYADQKNLWNAIVVKGRKQLNTFGLSNDQIDLLLNEIKNKL